jgi:hypothetical protein
MMSFDVTRSAFPKRINKPPRHDGFVGSGPSCLWLIYPVGLLHDIVLLVSNEKVDIGFLLTCALHSHTHAPLGLECTGIDAAIHSIASFA